MAYSVSDIVDGGRCRVALSPLARPRRRLKVAVGFNSVLPSVTRSRCDTGRILQPGETAAKERWAFNALQTEWTEPGVGGAGCPADAL